jgi:hypothetical protein
MVYLKKYHSKGRAYRLSFSVNYRLVNTIKPSIVKKVNNTKMAFKCMENINAFLEAARDLGVPAQETFQTVDLWERQNLNSVVICLQSLGRKVASPTPEISFCNNFFSSRLATSVSRPSDQKKPRKTKEYSPRRN